MKTPVIKIVLTSLAIALSAAFSPAANITLTASDGVGTSSLNSAGKWSDGNPPNPTNDYFTSIFFARTPSSGTSPITFAGNSLTLQPPSGQGSPMRSILFKGGPGTIVINNLTNAGGVINNGGSGNATATFTGNLMTLTANSTIIADQGPAVIGYPIVGSYSLTNVGSTQSGVHSVTYTGSLSGFTGKLLLVNLNGSLGMVINLNSGSSNLGNPPSPEPDQITIGLGCTLTDNVGLPFTNSNGGITLIANGSISAAATTLMGEPITDLTNAVSAHAQLTSSGGGTLILSNANNNYSGGTVISAGTLQLALDNAIPGNSVAGDVTVTSSLDLNGHNDTINGLSGAGTVDTVSGGTPTLTVGANGDNGTFTGTIQNSSGTLSLVKTGAGTETLSGNYTYTGRTLVAGGTLSLSTAGTLPSTPGDMIVTNGASLAVVTSVGIALPVNNLVLYDNANISLNYGNVTANPTNAAISATNAISAPGTNITISISALGLKTGTFSLIKYTGAALGSIANFSVILPNGVFGSLVNNTGNDSIDLTITQVPTQLTWNGVNGTTWDLTTPNWSNIVAGGITIFHQFDAVTFDDTLTNTTPQPTNITVTGTVFPTPLVFNSSLPYSLSGAGGIAGATSLLISNFGSVTLLTSNSFTGGVVVSSGTLIITNDDALGSNASVLTLNGGSLQINGTTTNNVRPINIPVATTVGVGAGAAARFGGRVTGVTLSKADLGPLVLGGSNIYSGNLFVNSGTIIIDSGFVTNNNFDSIGQQNSDNGTLILQGTGALGESGDFNVGDIGSSIGTLTVQDSATLRSANIFIASANAGGSSAQGTVNQNGGTVTQVSTATGNFIIGGRNAGSSLGVGIYNLNSGTLTAQGNVRVGGYGTGTFIQNGGTFNAMLGINLARQTGSSGTYNLNSGATLNTFNIGSSTGANAIFNFNGGTLKAAFTNGSPFMSGLTQANVQAGGAIIDDGGSTPLITQPLLAASPNGGLTHQGSGTLTMTGSNTFTGPITNNGGTLLLTAASTYSGAVQVNAGNLEVTSAAQLSSSISVNDGGIFSAAQSGSSTMSLSTLTLGVTTGASLGLSVTPADNPNVPFLNIASLTLNGTNTVIVGLVPLGTFAIINYNGAIAGSGTLTNLLLPQGFGGYLSNYTAGSTIYLVITNTSSGLVWTGTNSIAGKTNLWDVNTSTNWLANATPSYYQQFIIPGDAVTFNDIGTGKATLNTIVGPASLTISNNAKSYTFGGTGFISGNTGITKLGTGTAILNLTNNAYSGNTVVSNGTLQVGNASAISPAADIVIGSGGTLELNGQSPTGGQLLGSGVVNNSSGLPSTLTIGSATSGAWNGTMTNTGGGGMALIKNGTGTLVVGGSNYLNDAQPFTDHVMANSGSVVLTNGGLLSIPTLELRIADGNSLNSATSSIVVAGGTLVVTNNPISVGIDSNNANGTLIVNSGTIITGTGNPAGFFSESGNNTLIVGASGATGTLIINGGQVLDGTNLWLGMNPGASGTLDLNGGLLQVNGILNNNSPATSIANFNGGTLKALTNNSDFLDSLVTYNVMSNGLVLDDNGFTLSIGAGLQSGDAFNGGLIKKGSGTVYLDGGNSYNGATVVTNGTLGGSGSINGPLVVGPAGNLFPGDANAFVSSPLTVNNNNVTLNGSTTFRVSVNGGGSSSDQLNGIANITYGGTLIISNVTSDLTAMTNGQTFQLFNLNIGAGTAGNFSHIVGSPGVAGLSYVFYPATGVLGVTNAVVVKSVPHFSHISISGTTLNISATNGTQNGPFVLLGSTNLTLPVTNWTPVLSNSFDGSGNLNLSTNIVNPSVPIEFYLLSQ